MKEKKREGKFEYCFEHIDLNFYELLREKKNFLLMDELPKMGGVKWTIEQVDR